MKINDLTHRFTGEPDGGSASYEDADDGFNIVRERVEHVNQADYTLDNTVASLEAIAALPTYNPERVSEAKTAELEANFAAPSYEPSPAVAFDPNSAQGLEYEAREKARLAYLQVSPPSNQADLDYLRQQREQTRQNNG